MVNPGVMKRRDFMCMLAAGAVGLGGCRGRMTKAAQPQPNLRRGRP